VIGQWLSVGIKYCESLYLGSIVTSWLNPLRVCLPHIVTKFASVVRSDCSSRYLECLPLTYVVKCRKVNDLI